MQRNNLFLPLPDQRRQRSKYLSISNFLAVTVERLLDAFGIYSLSLQATNNSLPCKQTGQWKFHRWPTWLCQFSNATNHVLKMVDFCRHGCDFRRGGVFGFQPQKPPAAQREIKMIKSRTCLGGTESKKTSQPFVKSEIAVK